jgi:hypothetical protein
MAKKPLLSLKILLILVLAGLTGLALWRAYEATHPVANLFQDPAFEAGDLSAWKVLATGGAEAAMKPAVDSPENTVLELKLPTAGSGIGVGQHLPVEPLQRYRLAATYRFPGEGQNPPQILWRISQFDRQGRLIEQHERLDPSSQVASSASWSTLSHQFITAKAAEAVEIGIAFLGDSPALVEVDHLIFQPYPTWLSALRHDQITWIILVLVAGLLGYQLGRQAWPIRRKLMLNGAMAAVSLLLTLIAIEVLIGFFPIRIVRSNWPRGYFVPLKNGEGYRLAKNYPRTVITNAGGTENVVLGNSLGVRDIEIPSLPAEAAAILVLGDSLTFGEAGDVHESWPRRLDEQLAELALNPDQYHVINGGVSGYNTFQEVQLLPELLQDMAQQGIKPRVVLLSFFSGIWERNGHGPEGAFTVMRDILMYSAFKQAILNMPGRLAQQSGSDDLKLLDLDRLHGLHQFLVSRSRTYFVSSLLLSLRFDRAWREPLDVEREPQNREALRQFKQVAQAYGIQPVVVYLPGYDMFEKPGENQEIVEILAGLCNELGLTLINPYNSMQALGIDETNAKEKLTLVSDAHYSVEGNLIYAKALAPLLVDYFSTIPLSPSEP